MEVYFKELISEEASLEKLVDDLERVVQGADDFAKAIGVKLAEDSHSEIGHRLHRLKERCQHIKTEIVSRARATDKAVRANPYAFIAVAVLVGMFAGVRLASRH